MPVKSTLVHVQLSAFKFAGFLVIDVIAHSKSSLFTVLLVS